MAHTQPPGRGVLADDQLGDQVDARVAGTLPRTRSSSMWVAMAAMSCSGWWMVVRGGSIQLGDEAGCRSRSRRQVLRDAQGAARGRRGAPRGPGSGRAGEDRGGSIGPVGARSMPPGGVPTADEEVAVPDQRRVERRRRPGSSAVPGSRRCGRGCTGRRTGPEMTASAPVPEPEQVPGRPRARRPSWRTRPSYLHPGGARPDPRTGSTGVSSWPALAPGRRSERHEDDAARPTGEHVVGATSPAAARWRAAQLATARRPCARGRRPRLDALG